MFNSNDDGPKGPSRVEQVGIAVAIATLAAFTTSLVGWGVAELRNKFGSKPPTPPTPIPPPAKEEEKKSL